MIELSPSVGEQLWEWQKLTTRLASMRAKEMKLRKALASAIFPDPREGTNSVKLPGDWQLKLNHKLNRKLDEAALPAVVEKLGEWVEDECVKRNPSLDLKAYKALTPEDRLIFDEAVIETLASPSLELIAPKILPED